MARSRKAPNSIDAVWKPFNTIFSAGFGIATSVSMWYRRDAGDMLIRGTFTTGTATGAVGTITLAEDKSINTSLIHPTAFRTSFGNAYQMPSSTQGLSSTDITMAIVYNGTPTVVQFAWQTGSNLYVSESVNTHLGNSTPVNIENLRIPILGWS